MKKTAQYLDNGFYLISDTAAGALVRVLGKKLPRVGWEKFVFVRTDEGIFNAWLVRCDLRHCLRSGVSAPRGWRWAIKGLRRDGGAEMPALGREFQFEAVASADITALAVTV